jgi:hypothetical protein
VKPVDARILRPRFPRVGSPTPIEPEYGTDEWESWWLPDPVREWVEAAAAAFNVPLVMPIAAALCAASVVLQGKAKVRIHEAWEEELSLYWLVFAPTGMAKSGVMKAAMAPIRAMQRSLEDEMLPVIAERTNERARLEAQIQRMRRANKAHKYTEGAQEHLQQLRELEHDLLHCGVPVVPQWVYTDANPTVIPRLMAHNLAAEGIARVAVCDAEGTFLANLMGRHSGHLNVDPLLAGYTGDPIEMVRTAPNSTALQQFRMASSHMVMCIMVQPHYLDKLKAHPELGDNGWLGRCITSTVVKPREASPFMRPAVPDSVQAGYAEWLTVISQVPTGYVYEMPSELIGELERMHAEIQTVGLSNGSAAGYLTRCLGRICRIFALLHIGCPTVGTVGSFDPTRPVGPRHEGIEELLYLYNTLYSRTLSHAQALEPARATLPALCRRGLTWLRQLDNPTVTLRAIYRGLDIPKEDALTMCDALVESGHLMLAEQVTRNNKTLTVAYNVVSTDADCGASPPVDS